VARAVLILLLVFLVLMILRALRQLVSAWASRSGIARRSAPKEAQMLRDPVCGAWFDRRLAVSVRRGNQTVEVCSDGCRRRLEAG